VASSLGLNFFFFFGLVSAKARAGRRMRNQDMRSERLIFRRLPQVRDAWKGLIGMELITGIILSEFPSSRH